jgi:phospholipase/carboxylesterase
MTNVVVHALRSVSRRLAGGIVLSGWAAMQDQYGEGLIQPANKATPLLWGHGGADPTVVTACQTVGVKALTDAGLTVESETYPGLGHGSSPQEIEDVKDFIAKVLA